MLPDDLTFPLRVSTLMRRRLRDGSGRVADIETTRGADGVERVTALIVTAGRWGRLLGYERDQRTGPWVLEALARHVLRRHIRRVPWRDRTP
jgi:hypothetical protein